MRQIGGTAIVDKRGRAFATVVEEASFLYHLVDSD